MGVFSRRFGEFLDGDVVDDLPDGLSDGLLLVDPQGNVVQFITYEVNCFFCLFVFLSH